MSDDTISRQAAIDTALRAISDLKGKDVNRDEYIISEMEEIPSAERRGRWEHLGGDEWFCTACAHVITTEGSWERPWQKYCEECGARMEVSE